MKVLTVDEVASLLRLTRVTIYRMAKAGDIPALKVGKVWRFPEEEVEAWIHEKIQDKMHPADPRGVKGKAGR